MLGMLIQKKKIQFYIVSQKASSETIRNDLMKSDVSLM